ncbi:hypothetical protein [Nocardia mexicana]|uniref:Uncharacterized protein n=1 Tax=Nocardia mexicana TaxID=279262 RepID=A0A370H427_9NOCA|nr:hypothetical protein [Nocardia mexicana]RDI50939.1 hypothetical protein DFR68_105416 [Nocardia mexicana]
MSTAPHHTGPAPRWVKRNRFAAWAGYFCLLLAFASLGIGLTSAGRADDGWAILWGVVFLIAVGLGIGIVGTTVHRDHVEGHKPPHLL